MTNVQRFRIDGLCCDGCTGKVHMALKRIHGVSKVITDPDTHEAEVTFDPSKVCIVSLIESIHQVGFRVLTGSGA
ncbi:MAG: heavy-metal-associated domain-containing protein [Planctomycetota bacterium]